MKVTRAGAVVVPAVGDVVVANEAEGFVAVVKIVVLETVVCAVDCALLVVFATSCIGTEILSLNVVCDDAVGAVVSAVVVVFEMMDVDATVEMVVCADVFSLVVLAWQPHRRNVNAMHRQHKRFANGIAPFLIR